MDIDGMDIDDMNIDEQFVQNTDVSNIVKPATKPTKPTKPKRTIKQAPAPTSVMAQREQAKIWALQNL